MKKLKNKKQKKSLPKWLKVGNTITIKTYRKDGVPVIQTKTIVGKEVKGSADTVSVNSPLYRILYKKGRLNKKILNKIGNYPFYFEIIGNESNHTKKPKGNL